ncbi:MAG: hypothetical protein K1X75_16860 [Leptospirales bacterium]|nr:hypothetical protein [Leptospirales bacterium]
MDKGDGVEVKRLDLPELIQLLTHPKKSVGDLAAEELAARSITAEVAKAIISGALLTKPSKIRALSILRSQGSRSEISLRAYQVLADDKDDDVVADALFGLVFSENQSSLPSLRRLEDQSESGTRRRNLYTTAIRAIESANPGVFAPDYYDIGNVWGRR